MKKDRIKTVLPSRATYDVPAIQTVGANIAG